MDQSQKKKKKKDFSSYHIFDVQAVSLAHNIYNNIYERIFFIFSLTSVFRIHIWIILNSLDLKNVGQQSG